MQKAKININTIVFMLIALAMFIMGISSLSSLANIKPATINVDGQTKPVSTVNAAGNEARIGETEYATLEEAFAAANEMKNTVENPLIIYCIAPEISIESTIEVKSGPTLVCEGTDVTITRNFDGYLWKLVSYGTGLRFGASTDDEFQLTINGNNKAYPIINSSGFVRVNCGTFMGNSNSVATVQSSEGGFAYIQSSENRIEIYGGTFKNFYATQGGVICSASNNIDDAIVINGGHFINNKANWGGVIMCTVQMKINGGTFENNSAVVGGAIMRLAFGGYYDLMYITNGTFINNVATGDATTQAGIGNDIFNIGSRFYCFGTKPPVVCVYYI